MADIAAGIGALGGAVQDLFAGFGSLDSSKGSQLTADALLKAGASYKLAQRSYIRAEGIATHDAAISRQITRIQEQQNNRQVYQSESATQSEVAGAGFAAGGSGGDILRSSAQQGALAAHLIQLQGRETATAYVEQAQAYKGQAANEGIAMAQVETEAASEMQLAQSQKKAATGSFFGAILQGAAAVASFI